MKRPVLFFFCLLISFSPIKADEGMWLPILINKLKNVDLEKMGLQLSAEELYSVNNNYLHQFHNILHHIASYCAILRHIDIDTLTLTH